MLIRRISVCFVALAVLAACSSDTKPLASASSSSAAPTFAPPPPGLPDFYGVPDPMPDGKPGDVIKTEQLTNPSMHGTLLRVMYHSRSIKDKDIAVTGVIAIPSTPAPAGGFPVITWAHGTTGLADECAPSVDPAGDYVALANGLLDAGYLVVATDYEGLGTPGRHPYIVGESEARGTLDIVRAARKIADTHASDRYVVWGHSQGGHAAMYALHIAAQWAPELKLQGVVAGAPPSQLLLMYQVLQKSPYKYYLLMAAAGFNAAYGDDAPLDAVLNQAGIDALAAVDTGCSGAIAKATANVATADISKADPSTVPAWAKVLADNDPGKFTAPANVPLLVIQGGADEQIPTAATALMFDQLCAIGQVEQRWIYPGQSHAGVIGPSFKDMMIWIADRFSGEPAPDAKAPTGQPDVQTQSCPN